MPPLILPRVLFWGRPVRPVSFGFMLSMFVFTWAGWANVGALDGSGLADILSVFSAGVGFWLLAAWVFKKQWMAETGLLMVFTALIFRAVFTFLLLSNTAGQGPVPETSLLSVCGAIIAGGAWLLERSDPYADKKWG